MPAPATFNDFLDVCRKSGVVEESSLSAISGPAAATPVSAAKALIRTGALTKFQAGQLLAGKYRGLRFDRLKILDKIGAGGMGTVFLCEHLGLRKKVAVKVLPPDQAGDEGVRERFFREARAAAALDHPNIVRVHDMASSGGVHYIVMEYVEGQDLQSILNKYGAMPYGRACNYIAQSALGLQHAHEKGLVHRDIKPANLLVDKEGVVKILDLGLATFNADHEDKDNLTARFDKGAVLGTADFMAPEQVLESSNVDIRADIYSLGVTLYALVNGKPPFGGSCTQKLVGHTTIKPASLTQIRREIPKGLSAVVDKMIAKNPAERFQTPAEVVDALNPWLEADTIPLDAQQTRKMPGGAKSGPRRAAGPKSKAPLIVAAVAVSALVFGGLGAWALTGDGPDAASASDDPAAPIARANPPANTPRPQPKGNPPVPNLPVVAPAAADVARLVYEVDFAKGPAFHAKYDNKQRLSLDGEYPPGWTSQSWRPGAAAEVGVQDHNGARGVAVITTRGEGASAELQTVIGNGPYRFTPGRRYLLRTEYANVGTRNANFEVRFDAERPPVKNVVQLKPTRGEWQTADLLLTAPAHQKSTTYYTHPGAIFPNYLVVRSVQVFEYGDASSGPAQVVYQSNFGSLAPFSVRKRGYDLVDQTGELPAAIETGAWKKETLMEFAVEPDGGSKVLALRNLEGPGTAMIFLKDVPSRPGVLYWATIEYQSAAPKAGKLRVLPKGGKVRDVGDLPGTGGEWRKVDLSFGLETGEGDTSRLELHAYGVGSADQLRVRSVVISSGSPVTGAVASGPALYRLAAADLKPVRVPLANGQHSSARNVPELPPGVVVGLWKKEDSGEVAIEDVAGRRAISLLNGDGATSVQFFLGSAVAELRAGQEYTLKVVHWGGPAAGGRVELRKPQGMVRLISHKLPGTDGKWVETSARFTPDADGPVHLYIQNGASGPDGKVAVHSVEILAPSASPVTSAAPTPVARPTGYRLDLTTARPFARRYRKDAVVESLGEGTFPAPWSARTVQADTLGDIYIDPVGGSPALGLRNDQGPPSVELFCRSGLLQAKAGKRYAVRVMYQTEVNGKGGCQVFVNGEEAGGTAFAPSVGAWKDVELTIAATADGPLTMTITCGSVGSESAVLVKGIEIKEAP